MERSEILKRVEEIFREELGQDALVLTDETTAEDVEGWDSLSHVQLVAVMEDAFGIEFSSREILSWDNVGDLIDSIQKKVCCSMSSYNCCFLTCIQISQEAGKMVWYSYFLRISQFACDPYSQRVSHSQ